MFAAVYYFKIGSTARRRPAISSPSRQPFPLAAPSQPLAASPLAPRPSQPCRRPPLMQIDKSSCLPQAKLHHERANTAISWCPARPKALPTPTRPKKGVPYCATCVSSQVSGKMKKGYRREPAMTIHSTAYKGAATCTKQRPPAAGRRPQPQSPAACSPQSAAVLPQEAKAERGLSQLRRREGSLILQESSLSLSLAPEGTGTGTGTGTGRRLVD